MYETSVTDPDEFDRLVEEEMEIQNEAMLEEWDSAYHDEMMKDVTPAETPKCKAKRSLDMDFDITPNPGKKRKNQDTDSLENDVKLLSPAPNGTNKKPETEMDLFGDMADIDFEDSTINYNNNKNKRRKYSSPNATIAIKDALLIDKILEKRNNFMSRKISDGNESIKNIAKGDVILTKKLPDYAFITLRNDRGEKYYAKFLSNNRFNEMVKAASETRHSSGLLSTSFRDLLDEANAWAEKKNKKVSVPAKDEIPSSISNQLWVEKYKPVSYSDLLSDESTNRILLQWLKLWDKVVFGKEKVQKMKKREMSQTFGNKYKPQLDLELDENDCPKRKIALLCGPPGLGKTTLSHVLAKQAGYHSVEINASDDRSLEAFRTNLETATQMQSVLAKDPRPNCLILDEIDGAPANSVEFLVKFVKGEGGGKRGGGKKGNKNFLKRPIICVCNDVYVPALRSLRQIAFVVQFPPTPTVRLVDRLLQITRLENVQTDMGAMQALCEKANNDIRSCLSTIYCLKDRPIRLQAIYKANIGEKDSQRGLFTIWQDIFQIGLNEGPPKCASNNSDSPTAKRLRKVLSSVQSYGDYERLAQGVYENFPNMKIKDTSGVSEGMEWFCLFDRLHTFIQAKQNYALMRYSPYCFATWHLLFSNYEKPKLVYPSFLYELRMKKQHREQIIEEVLQGMPPKIRAFSDKRQLLMDVLPYLGNIIKPDIRPVSLQLLSSAEREELGKVVLIMMDYNLNYIQERTPEGSYEFIIDPNVEELVKFPNHNITKPASYAVKQLISREVELERLRRLDTFSHGSEVNGRQRPEIEISEKPKNHLKQKLTPKAIKKEPVAQARDFFGRIIENPVSKKASDVENVLKSDVWFHFKEGYSNAVRQPVYIKDL